MSDTVGLDTAIAEFLADLALGGRQEGTRKKHEQELLRLNRWCDEQGQKWHELTRPKLQPYTRLRAELGHSARSNMLCTLRVFFAWGVQQGYIAMSPAAGFKTPIKPEPLPRALTLEQIRQLVVYLKSQEGRRARRDEALLLTGLYAGLRASELARLTWPMVDISGKALNIRLTKGNRGRAVQLHDELIKLYQPWKELQALDDDSPVFSLDSIAIKPNRVGKICRQVSKGLGFNLTSHALRHSFATWAIRKGGNLYAVSKALGHRQLKQTQIYIAADVSDSAPAVASLPSLEDW